MYKKVKNGDYASSKHITCIVNHQDSYRRIIINRDYKVKKYHIDFFVAGYKYNNGNDIIEILSKNEPVNLIRENFNPYDPFATALYIDYSIRIGYVPSIISPLIAHKLEDKKNNVRAIIKNVKLDVDDECKIEIRLFIESNYNFKKNS